jgi:hypothetical protein
MLRARTRELRGLGSALGNNFVVFALALFALQPSGDRFLPSLIAILLFIPLCAGPFRNLPEERLRLLPLGGGGRLALQGVGLLLTPPCWIAAAMALFGGPGWRRAALWILLAALLLNLAFLLGERLLARRPGLNPFRWIPAPPGSLGGLVRKNLRELLHSLDAWLALAVAAAGGLYRLLAAHPAPEVGFGCALLVVLALSTCAQNLFAAEGAAGLERCRLLPVRGWRLLLAKDLAFLGLILALTLPLAPVAGLAGGMAALAVGHQASVTRQVSQPAWRFTSSSSSGLGLLQVAALFVAAILCHRGSPLWLLAVAATLGGSLGWHGRRLEG